MYNPGDLPEGPDNPSRTESAVIAKSEFLRTSIHKQLNSFQAKRDRNRKIALALRTAIVVLGVTVTVLLGLQVSGIQQYMSNVALILSGTITILSSLDGLLNYRTLWIRYTVTTNELHALKSNLDYLLTGGSESVSEEDIDKLYNRYQAILEETNEAWQETRRDKQTNPT